MFINIPGNIRPPQSKKKENWGSEMKIKGTGPNFGMVPLFFKLRGGNAREGLRNRIPKKMAQTASKSVENCTLQLILRTGITGPEIHNIQKSMFNVPVECLVVPWDCQ